MPITSNSTVTNNFVPNFTLTNVQDKDILIYSNIHDAFVNNDGSGLNLTISTDHLDDFLVQRQHISASEHGWSVGQVLSIDNTGKLVWSTLPTGVAPALNLNDLLDVNDVNRAAGSTLVFDGLEWYTVDFTVSNLVDVEVLSAVDGEVLVYNATDSKWENKLLNLADNNDVDATVPNLDEFLKWNGTTWIPSALPVTPTPLSTLADLTDTEISLPIQHQILKWNGIDTWYNDYLDYAGVSNTPDLSIYAETANLSAVAFSGEWADILNPAPEWNTILNVPTEFTPVAHTHLAADITDLVVPVNLDDLLDVNSASAISGDLLGWNGAAWEPTTVVSAALSTLTDVSLVNPVNKQFLNYNGTEWVNANISTSHISDFAMSVYALNGNFNFASLSDTGTPTDGYMKWNANSVSYVTTIPNADVDGLSNVATSGLYSHLNGIPSEFTPSAHSHVLSEVTDVVVTLPSHDDILSYNSATSNWENRVLSSSEIIPDGVSGDVLRWVGSQWIGSTIDLNDIADVNAPLPISGQFLKRVGTEWVPMTIDYTDIAGVMPSPQVHTHVSADITDLASTIAAQNATLTFAALADTSTPTDGILKWDTISGEMTYVTSIDVSEITGLSAIATSGSYNDLTDVPVAIPSITDFVGLSDTTATPVPSSWLRWDATGTIITYQNGISALSDVSDLAAIATSGSYNDLTDTPLLQPLATTAQWSDILNPAPDWNTILNIPMLFPPATHSHNIADVAGLQLELDSKIEADVISLPSLTVDYDTQVTGNKPIIPVNGTFSFVGLNDTANDVQQHRVSKYLRWDPTGQEVIYEEYIDADVITGLATVARTNEYTDLDNYLKAEDVIIDYNSAQLTNAPDLSIYEESANLKTVAYTNKYYDLDPSSLPTLFDGNYSSLNGIPTAFAPTAHTHTAADITGIVVSLELNDLTNVNANPTSDGDVVSWDATGNTWIARPGSKVTGMIDVADIPLPNGYFRWNTSGTEVLFEENISAANITGLSTIATTGFLADITDGSITNLVAGESLVWDGTAWRNGSSTSGFTGTFLGVFDLTSPRPNSLVQTNGSYVLNDTAGTVDATWSGIGGQVVTVDDLAVYDGLVWHHKIGVDISTKIDKVPTAIVGNFGSFDVSGNLLDSALNAASFATAAQGATADTALQVGASSNDIANASTVSGATVSDALNGLKVTGAEKGVVNNHGGYPVASSKVLLNEGNTPAAWNPFNDSLDFFTDTNEATGIRFLDDLGDGSPRFIFGFSDAASEVLIEAIDAEVRLSNAAVPITAPRLLLIDSASGDANGDGSPIQIRTGHGHGTGESGAISLQVGGTNDVMVIDNDTLLSKGAGKLLADDGSGTGKLVYTELDASDIGEAAGFTNTYYVDVNGDAAMSGSDPSFPTTLSVALANITHTDLIMMGEGVYTTGGDITMNTSNITIKSLQGGTGSNSVIITDNITIPSGVTRFRSFGIRYDGVFHDDGSEGRHYMTYASFGGAATFKRTNPQRWFEIHDSGVDASTFIIEGAGTNGAVTRLSGSSTHSSSKTLSATGHYLEVLNNARSGSINITEGVLNVDGARVIGTINGGANSTVLLKNCSVIDSSGTAQPITVEGNYDLRDVTFDANASTLTGTEVPMPASHFSGGIIGAKWADLKDTPTSFTADKGVKVNSAADALEYYDIDDISVDAANNKIEINGTGVNVPKVPNRNQEGDGSTPITSFSWANFDDKSTVNVAMYSETGNINPNILFQGTYDASDWTDAAGVSTSGSTATTHTKNVTSGMRLNPALDSGDNSVKADTVMNIEIKRCDMGSELSLISYRMTYIRKVDSLYTVSEGSVIKRNLSARPLTNITITDTQGNDTLFWEVY